jgi:hypothetical protein
MQCIVGKYGYHYVCTVYLRGVKRSEAVGSVPVLLLDVTSTLLIGVQEGAAPLGCDMTASVISPST